MSISGNLQKLNEIKNTFLKKFLSYEVDISEDTLFEDYPSFLDKLNFFSGVVKLSIAGASASSYVTEEASKTVIDTTQTVSLSTSFEQVIEEDEEE